MPPVLPRFAVVFLAENGTDLVSFAGDILEVIQPEAARVHRLGSLDQLGTDLVAEGAALGCLSRCHSTVTSKDLSFFNGAELNRQQGGENRDFFCVST